jgi:hypothetical protein
MEEACGRFALWEIFIGPPCRRIMPLAFTYLHLPALGMEWNGMAWHGMDWNGIDMEWHGLEWHGLPWPSCLGPLALAWIGPGLPRPSCLGMDWNDIGNLKLKELLK